MYNHEYVTKAVELIGKIDKSQKDIISNVAKIFAKNIEDNKIIHVFGTGHSHMVGIEMHFRAGGLANVNAMLDPASTTQAGARRSGALEKLEGLADIIYDQYKVFSGDILVIASNSGRNALPIEMAMRAKKEGITTIAITNVDQSQNTTSRHSSGKKLYEIVDFVIDNCCPTGDSLMEISKIPTAPASSIANTIIVNTLVNESLKILAEKGETIPVFGSQNLDGYNNEDLYAKYEDRVKHL